MIKMFSPSFIIIFYHYSIISLEEIFCVINPKSSTQTTQGYNLFLKKDSNILSSNPSTSKFNRCISENFLSVSIISIKYFTSIRSTLIVLDGIRLWTTFSSSTLFLLKVLLSGFFEDKIF